MNPLAYPVSRIVGLEPRSATPAANTIPIAGSGGTIADGWLSSNVPRLNAANTFTANQTVNASLLSISGSSDPAAWISEDGSSGLLLENDVAVRSRVRHISDSTESLLDVDTMINNGAGECSVRVFRDSNTTGNCYVRVYRGNGSGTINTQLGANRDSYLNASTGNVAIGGTTSTAKLHVHADTWRLQTTRTPASATATGNQGDQCYDGTYIYWCSATNTWQRIIRLSVNTPAQFTANQNNWSPTIAKVWRVSTDASRDLTGINISQWGGDEHSIVNVGSNNIVLKHQDTNSTAAYRFISVTGADITLAAGEMALLWYDSTSLRWRIAKV